MERIAGVALAAALLLFAGKAPGQQPVGPISPTSPPVIHRIPLHPEVPPPPLPPDEIVRRFTANEALYRDAYKKYGYIRTIRVEEFGSGGDNPTGVFDVRAEVHVRTDGEQYGRFLDQTPSTLQYLYVTPPGLEMLIQMPLFPLAGAASADYNFTYRGTEKLDELNTYAFLVEPKTLQPGHRYFNGVVWVDNEDLAIVKSYGKFVADSPPPSYALPFVFFEAYRENIEGRYWFPTYIRSDDVFRQQAGEMPIRLIIRSTDFHLGEPQPPAPSH